jgi:DNA-binding HxlR family transcriptional regulator
MLLVMVFGRRDFEANLDISKNVLSARLEHLVARGVLARVDPASTARATSTS